MAEAYKCDRCKQFKDGTPHAELQQRKVGNPEILTKQLCEDCSETVDSVANGGYSECATVCTYHTESGCVQVLSCIVEKGVTPPKTLLDPCPGTGYEGTRLATLAYKARCK